MTSIRLKVEGLPPPTDQLMMIIYQYYYRKNTYIDTYLEYVFRLVNILIYSTTSMITVMCRPLIRLSTTLCVPHRKNSDKH